jgi:hypothetical protein
LFRRLAARFVRRRSPTPLRTHHDDVRLVRRVHGRLFPRVSQLRHLGKILSPIDRRVIQASALVGVVGLV